MLHMDEIRAWNHMLQLVEAILPCPLCQKHYRAWRKANPLQSFLETNGPLEFYEAARLWVWRLHDSVNERRGVPRLSFEEAMATVATVMTTTDLQQALEKLLVVLEAAKLQRMVEGVYVREWRQKLAFLRKFLRV